MAGRPPSEKTFANMLRVAIKEAHEDGKDRLRAVADALVMKALTGDVPAIREIGDRLDGKVMQQVEHSGFVSTPSTLTDSDLASIIEGGSSDGATETPPSPSQLN
jgi:hypothetical protein